MLANFYSWSYFSHCFHCVTRHIKEIKNHKTQDFHLITAFLYRVTTYNIHSHTGHHRCM